MSKKKKTDTISSIEEKQVASETEATKIAELKNEEVKPEDNGISSFVKTTGKVLTFSTDSSSGLSFQSTGSQALNSRSAANSYFERLVDELRQQFAERMDKLGLGVAFADAEASASEKAKAFSQRDEFIGRELFRKYGYEEFVNYCDGFADSDYWTNRMEFMRPCNAYNGSCRFDCPYLGDETICPQKGQ